MMMIIIIEKQNFNYNYYSTSFQLARVIILANFINHSFNFYRFSYN